jgi:hypothetical protein
MVNRIATHIGRKPILVRDVQPLEQSTIDALSVDGWAIKQWEPEPKVNPLIDDICMIHFPNLKVG